MKLLLVDGSALLHRAYHAYPPLTSKTGEVVGAVYGVVSILITALEEVSPTHVVVAWDLPKPTFRHEKYIGYKAQRPRADEEMVEQIPKVKEMIERMGLVQLAEEGYEADDIIGTLARQAEQNNQSPNSNHQTNSRQSTEIIILTGDQDTMQLVSESVKVLTPAKGKNPPIMYGESQVRLKYGVEPSQIVDYKALIGDPSDNIPGVAGVGPKTASTLLNEYGSLENIYNNLDKIVEKQRVKLEEGRDSAMMSQDLSRIVTDMKIEVDEDTIEYKGLQRDELKEELELLGFKSILRRIFPQEIEVKKAKINENQMGLF